MDSNQSPFENDEARNTQQSWDAVREQAQGRWPGVSFRESPAPEWASAFVRVALPRAPFLDEWCLVRAALDGDTEARRLLNTQVEEALGRFFAAQESPEPLRAEVREATRRGLWGSDGRMAKLLQYDARGPLDAWIQVVGLRLAAQSLREAGVLGRESPEGNPATPLLLRAEHRGTFKEVLERALGRLSDRDRLLLGLRYAQAQSPAAVARTYRVDRPVAEQWIRTAQAALLTALREELSTTFFADEDIGELSTWMSASPERAWMRIIALRG